MLLVDGSSSGFSVFDVGTQQLDKVARTGIVGKLPYLLLYQRSKVMLVWAVLLVKY